MPSTSDARTLTLEPFTGSWPDDDPDANFKADLALYAHVDPLETIRNLSANIGVPVGALGHYVLAKWATAGSGGLLAAVCDDAEAVGTDEARLAAYGQLREMLGWLRHPLEHPEVYGSDPGSG